MSQAVPDRLSRIIAGASIMMIDDEPINMEVLQIHLESAGYSNFTSIEDSTQALKALEEHRPDVVLLDIVMPEVSGFDILEAMVARPELAEIPVIVLTSSDDPATKLRALELGATDFLAKPLDPSELALRMRNTLAARSWQLRRTRMDELTELPNTECLSSLLESEFEQVSSQSSSSVLAIVNLNRFKAINLEHGTSGGDVVLWAVRERLISSFGRNDPGVIESLTMDRNHPTCIARLGADRFGVLMTSLSPDTLGKTVAHRVSHFLESLEDPVLVDGKRVYTTASVGIARLDADAEDPLSLVSVAETAMGVARDRGENGYAFYASDMDSSARQRLTLEHALRTAIEDQEIFLTYQPKVDVMTGDIAGAEALVRWDHPVHGMISPVDFIPLAEDSGLIVSIGRWVMQQACMQAKKWLDAGLTTFRIAVNVSIRQLQEPTFIETVQEILIETGLPPRALIVELTENMIMENAETNVGKLQRLRDLGVGLSIDDFGTGYSSLAYLQRFPLDQLKIDQSFVSEIIDENSEVPIVKAIVSLAHDLNLEVVAEGVETELQLERLRSLGCEEFQGYLISKPVRAEEFSMLLAHRAIKRKAA